MHIEIDILKNIKQIKFKVNRSFKNNQLALLWVT